MNQLIRDTAALRARYQIIACARSYLICLPADDGRHIWVQLEVV